MNTVQVKNTVIGEGRPKICVPIVGKTKTDILEEAKKITTLPVDVVEWRRLGLQKRQMSGLMMSLLLRKY